MDERILGRLESRFVFVVGKGGVGKTTTAGAVALALADRGERVHLLSTDPAHSLGDLFETSSPPGRSPASACGDALLLEELDAEARWSAWRDGAREPLTELLDRGTYLDREDVEAFLDLSLPGVDEVAALLRLTDLEAGDAGRVVVDTAPTGHTLRLLSAATMLRGWVDVFEAVDAKARAVLEGLMHRSVRLSSAAVIEDLRDRADRFDERVVRGGDSLVVERPEAMVDAESGRLRDALSRLGVRVAARVRVEDAAEALSGADAARPDTGAARAATEGAAAEGADHGDAPVVSVPRVAGLIGCEGLRRWGEPSRGRRARPATGHPGAHDDPGHGGARALEVVAGLPRDLVLFVGKGGVGKTTCAAACALALAADRDVELLGVDPAGSLADVLGVAVDAGGVEVAPRLVARELDAETAFREFKERYRDEVEEAFRRVGLDRAAALDRRVVASLLELAPPGIDELLAVTALLEGSRRGATRVVDTAPTGHLLRLLETPDRGLAWVRQLMRVLVKYRAALGLDGLAERLLDLAKKLKDLNLKLRDPDRSGAVVVTLSGPLDVAETGRLLPRLHELGIPVAALVRNRWHGDAADPPGAIGAPVLRAPALRPPPSGPEALRDFLATWSVP